MRAGKNLGDLSAAAAFDRIGVGREFRYGGDPSAYEVPLRLRRDC